MSMSVVRAPSLPESSSTYVPALIQLLGALPGGGSKRPGVTVSARKGYFAVRDTGGLGITPWEAPALTGPSPSRR